MEAGVDGVQSQVQARGQEGRGQARQEGGGCRGEEVVSGFGSFDGAADEVESASGVVKRKPVGGGAVAGRIKALEEKAKEETKKNMITRKPLPGLSSAGAPPVYPLHVNRVIRRSGSAAPTRPETPLYKSTPDDTTVIHAPRATKSIPMLDRPSLQHAPTVYKTPPVTADEHPPREGTQSCPRHLALHPEREQHLAPLARRLSFRHERPMRAAWTEA